jgi:hypothetical protein
MDLRSMVESRRDGEIGLEIVVGLFVIDVESNFEDEKP